MFAELPDLLVIYQFRFIVVVGVNLCMCCSQWCLNQTSFYSLLKLLLFNCRAQFSLKEEPAG